VSNLSENVHDYLMSHVFKKIRAFISRLHVEAIDYSHPHEVVQLFLIIIDLESPENCTALVLTL